jgi:hypothetical protein
LSLIAASSLLTSFISSKTVIIDKRSLDKRAKLCGIVLCLKEKAGVRKEDMERRVGKQKKMCFKCTLYSLCTPVLSRLRSPAHPLRSGLDPLEPSSKESEGEKQPMRRKVYKRHTTYHI